MDEEKDSGFARLIEFVKCVFYAILVLVACIKSCKNESDYDEEWRQDRAGRP